MIFNRERLASSDPAPAEYTYLEYAQQDYAIGREIPIAIRRTDTQDLMTIIALGEDVLHSLRATIGKKWGAPVKFYAIDPPRNYYTSPGSYIDQSGNRTIIDAQVIRTYRPPHHSSDSLEPLRTHLSHLAVFCLDTQQTCARICPGRNTVQNLNDYASLVWKSSSEFCFSEEV